MSSNEMLTITEIFSDSKKMFPGNSDPPKKNPAPRTSFFFVAQGLFSCCKKKIQLQEKILWQGKKGNIFFTASRNFFFASEIIYMVEGMSLKPKIADKIAIPCVCKLLLKKEFFFG